MAREFDVPLPTVHHVLSTLAQEGLLEKDAARRYHMGANVGVLSGSFVREQGVPSVWQRALAELASSTASPVAIRLARRASPSPRSGPSRAFAAPP